MPVTIAIPSPLRPLAGNQAEIRLDAATVAAALGELGAKYPALKERLLDANGKLRRYVNVFKNEDDVRAAQGLDTPLVDGDKLAIVPAIAGG